MAVGGFGANHPQTWPADGSLPPHVAEFVEWLLMPKWERADDEKSQNMWAAKHGLAPVTVSHWKKDTRVKKAIETRCDELNLSTDRVQEVINAVFKAATEGDMKAATLYLQHADRLAPKRLVIEDRTLASMSDDELLKELAAAGVNLG